jgi:hypothetical protein
MRQFHLPISSALTTTKWALSQILDPNSRASFFYRLAPEGLLCKEAFQRMYAYGDELRILYKAFDLGSFELVNSLAATYPAPVDSEGESLSDLIYYFWARQNAYSPETDSLQGAHLSRIPLEKASYEDSKGIVPRIPSEDILTTAILIKLAELKGISMPLGTSFVEDFFNALEQAEKQRRCKYQVSYSECMEKASTLAAEIFRFHNQVENGNSNSE